MRPGGSGVRLVWWYLEQVVQRVLPGLGEELLLDADEGRLPQTLQTHHHAWNTGTRQTTHDSTNKQTNKHVVPLGKQQSTRIRGGIRWSPHSSPDDGLGAMATTNAGDLTSAATGYLERWTDNYSGPGPGPGGSDLDPRV